MEGSDPRVSKPRLPKPYTEEQLVFLRSHISGFETRTRSHVRGDAKKFALDRASEFLVRFGLPPDLQGVEEAEPRFREQIYNWYKNTVGRARRKLEGRIRPKKSDKTSTSSTTAITWTPSLATTSAITYAPPTDATTSDQANTSTAQTLQTPPQPQPNPGPSSQQQQQQQQPQPQQLQFTFQSSLPVPSASTIALNVTPSALRDAFITSAIDAPTLSSLIQSYVLTHPSATPLVPVIGSLFDAATHLLGRGGGGTGAHDRDQLFALLRRFADACAFFPSSVVHADVSGPLAGPRALQIALRKASVWAPSASSPSSASTSSAGTTTGGTGAVTAHGSSLSDEMERIAADRQRRKEYVQWAQMHAAALELGLVPSHSHSHSSLAAVVAAASSSSSSPTPTTASSVGIISVGVGVNGGSTYHHRPSTELSSSYGVPPSQSLHTHTHAHNTHPHGHGHGHAHTHGHSHAHVQPQPQSHHPPVVPLSFSESMARDAVWEPDEVEWVAGIIVLRAIIRTSGGSSAGAGAGVSTAGTGVGVGVSRKTEYEQLLGAYERRWKEIKDEARQAIVTEVLLGARDDLARMGEGRVT